MTYFEVTFTEPIEKRLGDKTKGRIVAYTRKKTGRVLGGLAGGAAGHASGHGWKAGAQMGRDLADKVTAKPGQKQIKIKLPEPEQVTRWAHALGEARQAVSKPAPSRFGAGAKIGTGLAAVGAIGGGAALAMHEHDKNVAKSAFGVEHVSKTAPNRRRIPRPTASQVNAVTSRARQLPGQVKAAAKKAPSPEQIKNVGPKVEAYRDAINSVVDTAMQGRRVRGMVKGKMALAGAAGAAVGGVAGYEAHKHMSKSAPGVSAFGINHRG